MYDIVSRSQKDDKMDTDKGHTDQGQGQDESGHDLLSNGGNNDAIVDAGDTASLHPEQVIYYYLILTTIFKLPKFRSHILDFFFGFHRKFPKLVRNFLPDTQV